MDANEIRENGQLLKTWKQMNGSWYEDSFELWKVDDKYYEIKNHVCISFSGTLSYWGKVREVEAPSSIPTHLCIIFGQNKGEAYIKEQRQGTPEELAEWAAKYIQDNEIGYVGKHRHLSVKMVELQLD